MAKRVLVFFIAAFFGLFMQSSVAHTVSPSPWAVTPDFIGILVLYTALYIRGCAGVIVAFFLGLCSDFASAQYAGPNAAGMLLAYLILIFISDKVFAEKSFAMFLLGFVVSLVKSFTVLAMLSFYVDGEFYTSLAFQRVGLEALFTGILAPLVVRFLQIVEGNSAAPKLINRY